MSPVQQQASYDSVFHQLQQAQHHCWQSTWHWTHHPNTKQEIKNLIKGCNAMRTNRQNVYNEKTFNLKGVNFTWLVHRYSLAVTSSLFVYISKLCNLSLQTAIMQKCKCVSAKGTEAKCYWRVCTGAFSALSVTMHYKWGRTTPKITLPLGGSGPPPKTWFFGPTRAHNPNGISVRSGISLQLATRILSLYFKMGWDISTQNCPRAPPQPNHNVSRSVHPFL